MPVTHFALLDTETTGLPDDPDARVIELGVAMFDATTGELTRTWSSLVCPDVLTDAGVEVAMQISGITRAEIESAPSPTEAWTALREVLDGAPVHCWNLAFDKLMCERTFVPANAWWAGCVMVEFQTLWVRCFGHNPQTGAPNRVHLRRAARIAQITWDGEAHRAEADAVVAGRIYALMRRGELQPPKPTFETSLITVGSGRPDPSTVIIGRLVVGSTRNPSNP